MEAQIKEEAKEVSLCFESSGDDNIASLSLVEKYDRFLQFDESDIDSDDDFFPDKSILKEEFAQLRQNTTTQTGNHRLSTALPSRYKNLNTSLDETRNGTSTTKSCDPDTRPSAARLNELIEKLSSARKCGPEDSNSILCTESELEAIQERYSDILNYMKEKSADFERVSNAKEQTDRQSDMQDKDGEKINVVDHDEVSCRLSKRMESVQSARDRFYEVEQHVREQLEQLELVERYKMESVG